MRSCAAIAAVFTFLLAGCGGPKLYPVEGSVLWTDGKPALELVGGAVTFEAADGSLSATGAIESGGRYHLYTSRPGDGVPAGEYTVTLSPPLVSDPDRPPPPVLHPDYQRLETTKLRRVTVAAGNNDIPLKLERYRP